MLPKGGLNNLMKQINKMQENVEKINKEMGNLFVEGTAGGGMVQVKANGNQEIISVKIDPEILSDDVEMVEDMIVAATNQAIQKAKELYQEKISQVTGGLMPNLPGGFKIPGL